MKLLQGSWFLKLLALLCAILTYGYVHNEIQLSSKAKTPDLSYKLFKPVVQEIPVKARIATEAPEGYQVVAEEVKINPSVLIVIGPEAMLDDSATVETALIDTEGSTRSFSKKVPLETVAGIALSGQMHFVDVWVPIEKIEDQKER